MIGCAEWIRLIGLGSRFAQTVSRSVSPLRSERWWPTGSSVGIGQASATFGFLSYPTDVDDGNLRMFVNKHVRHAEME